MNDLFHNKTTIIFDFDGTIANSFSLHEAAFQTALQYYNLKFAYKDYLGMSTREAFKRIFIDNGIDLPEDEFHSIVRRKQLLANHAYCTSLNFIEGAQTFIQLVYENGLDLYIGSSGSRMNIHAGLKALGINQYFAGVVTSDDISLSKPDPEVFQTISRNYKINPAFALVIEDAESGIEAALAAGLEVVCIESRLSKQYSHNKRVRFLSFSQLIEGFKSYVQYKKSTDSDRDL